MEAHESDLIIWNAANRFLHANLPEGTKSFKVSEWQKEFDELKAQSTGEYEELKTKRSEVKELQQIRKCIDIVEQAEQRTQEQTHQTPRRKKEDKLPARKALQAEIEQLISEKDGLYNTYHEQKQRFKELQTVKRNINQILRRDEPHRRKEQSHER